VSQSFVSPALRARVRGLVVPIALGLGRIGLTPNALTIIGFVGTAGAAVAAASQAWLLAGILVLAFGIFDLFDGALARATGTASPFGACLDSTLDRTGENLVYAGVAYGSAMADFPLGVGLAGLAMAFASVVTYARAKAEVIGLHGEVGIAPRPERLVALTIGLVLAGLYPFTVVPSTGTTCVESCLEPGALALAVALGIIVVTSAITVLQRILSVRRQLDEHPSTPQATR
jgi:CDP-diacylglycerol--glycerol-3-phosphate 3-phosphatidyltransferase